MDYPNNALKLAKQLFETQREQEKFLFVLFAGASQLGSVIATDLELPESAIRTNLPDWAPDFIYTNQEADVPETHYKLDFSSIFASTPLLTIPSDLETVLDVCAAPGGKSIICATALQPKVIVCNEVIGKRLKALISNLNRCNIANATVVSRDTSILAEKWPLAFDLVLVDAPCSGQSLLAKGEKALSCFHPATINLNANRQRRILANSLKCVAPGGYLLYSTCTFSIKENEKVVDWLLKSFPDFKTQKVDTLLRHQSKYTESYCYRLWPDQEYGAGAFCALFKNTSELSQAELELENLKALWSSKSQ